MRRLFLDANVLFTAAHNPKGKAAFIIAKSGTAPWDVYTSAFAVEEARRNLERKFPSCVSAFEALIPGMQRAPEHRDPPCHIPLEEKDRPILAAATACGATHLLTGDVKHFGPFMNAPDRTGGVTIQAVAEFLRDLSGEP